VTCPSCGAQVADAPFCSNCGTAVWTCEACGAPNAAASAACAVCGDPRSGAAAPPAAAAPPPAPRQAPPRPVPPAAPRYAPQAAPHGAPQPPPAPAHSPTPAPPGYHPAPAYQPAPGYQPAYDAPAAAAPPRPRPAKAKASSGTLTGVARAVHTRNETRGMGDNTSTQTVVSFRVDRFDDEGRPQQPVPVEMRGYRYRGAINDGDWVEIDERWRPGELLEPKKVKNLTTGSVVEATNDHRVLKTLIGLVVFLILAGVLFTVFLSLGPDSSGPFG
jgi:hypothetical protein